MATARERLLQALTAIISEVFNEEGKLALNRLLNAYRVQAKPGENLENAQTARNSLADKIIDTWKENHEVSHKDLNRIISSYRMQMKQGLSRKKRLDGKDKEDLDQLNKNKILTRAEVRRATAKNENAYFKDKRDSDPHSLENAQIAGGPKQGSNTRGQCPKCRSMGIVRARAYGGEDYFSCIYCGHQSYLKGVDPKLDLPLAAELLGMAFGTPDLEDED